MLFFFSFKASTAFCTPSNFFVTVLPPFVSTKVCSYFVIGATFAFESKDVAGFLLSVVYSTTACFVVFASVVSFADSGVVLDCEHPATTKDRIATLPAKNRFVSLFINAPLHLYRAFFTIIYDYYTTILWPSK